MDKKPIGYKAGQTYFMDKKIKPNPKYSGVQGTLNTGLTVDKVQVVTNNQVKKRRDEIFNRIGKISLAKLLQIEKYSESIYALDYNQHIDERSLKETEFHPDDTKSVFTGIGSNMTGGTRQTIMTVKTVTNEVVDINDETDYVILDLREPDEYREYHIKDSISFPVPLVNRNQFNKTIIEYKNKANHLIIVYHNDEKHGIPAINVMAERGFENAYLLSAGIEEFWQAYPQLIEGKNPPIPDPKKMKKQ